MNIKELIEKYELELKDVQLKFGANYKTKVYEGVLDDLKQLDEPQKPVVPQFVADWYERNRDDFEGNLFRCAHNIPSTFDGAKLNEFERWFLNSSIKAFQTLVNMHQFGYTVEEKRYRVNVKNVRTRQGTLNRSKKSGVFIFSNPEENNLYGTKFTRKELEDAGFGEVFNSPLFEVEEVEG